MLNIRKQKQHGKNKLNSLPLVFINNAGQVDPLIQYYACGACYGFYFTKERIVLTFSENPLRQGNRKFLKERTSDQLTVNGISLAIHFLGANHKVSLEGLRDGTGKVNYLLGNNPALWYTNLQTYDEIIYRELWAGVDLVVQGNQKKLKYLFIVKPGARPEAIKFTYQGAEKLDLDAGGNLYIHTQSGTLVDESPISYQEINGQKVFVPSSFVLNSHETEGVICRQGWTMHSCQN